MLVGKPWQWMALLRVDVRLWRREIDAAAPLIFRAGLSSTRPGPSPLQQLPTVVTKEGEAQEQLSVPSENRSV